MTPAPIRIAAALLITGDRQTLLVRKHGSALFMEPGGNIEVGEAPAELFRLSLAGGAMAARAEIAWVDPVETGQRVLAPLTRDHVLALCRSCGRA